MKTHDFTQFMGDLSSCQPNIFGTTLHAHLDQIPDNFIEFSRAGYGSAKDKKLLKLLDAKYRFERGALIPRIYSLWAR